MNKNASLKNIVRHKYSQIAEQSNRCGCRSGCCGENISYSLLSDDYSQVEGYIRHADLGLGCGLPTEHAGIKKGDIVVDLGAGAGNDAFIARHLVGASGHVVGVDMTPAMVTRAILNAVKLGFENVEFRLGEIEELPVANDFADVVLSNCVLNLVPDKKKAFAEIYRILKYGGHFCISDIVLQGELPDKVKNDAELYVGCVSGAIQESDYLDIIRQSGFVDIDVKVKQATPIPDAVLHSPLSDEQVKELQNANIGIFSITVVAYKK